MSDEKLDKIIQLLEEVLKRAKSDRRVPRNPWDVIGPGLPPVPTYEYKKECSQCGIKFGDGPIGYSCPQKNCPCGLGSPWCGMPTL